jgi:hypothetical protein
MIRMPSSASAREDRMRDFISDEFVLVATCCRWPHAAEVADDLRRRAADPLDWDLVLRIAERHRVVGLLRHALDAADLPCPENVKAIINRKSTAIAVQNLALAAETLRLQRHFDEAGIPAVVLKGASLAQRAYGTTAVKHGRDIDLLVPKPHAFAALRLMESDGYALVDPARELTDAQRHAYIARGYQIELADPRRGARVELHWALSENPHLLAGIDPFAHGQLVPLAGGAVRTLEDADLFAYLCVHGANHFWFRLKWLADLDALLGAIGEAGLEALYAHAQARGAGLCAGQALLLCARLLGRRLPAHLHDALMRDRGVRRLLALGLETMIGPDPAAVPARDAARQAAELRWRFLLGRGARFVLAQCAITVTAPADVLRWPLPPALRFVYPLVRLPSWVIRRR